MIADFLISPTEWAIQKAPVSYPQWRELNESLYSVDKQRQIPGAFAENHWYAAPVGASLTSQTEETSPFEAVTSPVVHELQVMMRLDLDTLMIQGRSLTIQ